MPDPEPDRDEPAPAGARPPDDREPPVASGGGTGHLRGGSPRDLARARSGAPALEPGQLEPYRDPRARARVLRGAVWVVVALEVVWLLAATAVVVTGSTVGSPTWRDLFELLGVVYAAGWIAAFVFAVRWQNAVLRNLPVLGARGVRYGPVAAALSWLIVVWNLFGPKVLVNDLWRGTSADHPDRQPIDTTAPVPRHLLVWWLTFLAYSAATGASGALAAGPELLIAQAVTVVLAVVSAALFVRVVTRLSARQEELREARGVNSAA